MSAAREHAPLTSELGTTGLTQGNLRHESWDASVGPSWQLTERWRLHANAENVRPPISRISNRRLLDYGYSTAMLTHLVRRSAKSSRVSLCTAGRLNSDGNTRKHGRQECERPVAVLLVAADLVRCCDRPLVGDLQHGREPQRVRCSICRRHTSSRRALVSFSVSRRQAPSGRALLTEADEALCQLRRPRSPSD